MKRAALIICLLFVTNFLFSENADCEEEGWTFDFDAGYAFGQFIGLKQNYGEVGLFIAPRSLSPWYPFAQLNGYWLQDNKWAASAGAGVRRMNECCDRLYGVNFFYDGRRGCRSKVFNRFGIGLESLGRCLDFRINGYLPFQEKHHCCCSFFDQYTGGFFWKQRESEFVFRGVDAEIGYQFWKGCDFFLYGAAGPYYYYNKRIGGFAGAFVRLELTWQDYLSFIVRVSGDKEFHTQVQGEVLVTIPLYNDSCCNPCPTCCISPYQPVERNNIIFTKNVAVPAGIGNRISRI